MAYVKKRCEWYVNSSQTNQISNGIELLQAIMSNGGPKNTKMCVIEIDKKITKLTGVLPVKNISNFHTIVSEENGAKYFEFYEIGNGIHHNFSGVFSYLIFFQYLLIFLLI